VRVWLDTPGGASGVDAFGGADDDPGPAMARAWYGHGAPLAAACTPAHAAWRALTAAAGPDDVPVTGTAYRAARKALEHLDAAGDATAADALARAIQEAIPELLAALGWRDDDPPAAADDTAERDGMLAVDARFADWLDGLGAGERAQKTRQIARRRLASWRDAGGTLAATAALWRPWHPQHDPEELASDAARRRTVREPEHAGERYEWAPDTSGRRVTVSRLAGGEKAPVARDVLWRLLGTVNTRPAPLLPALVVVGLALWARMEYARRWPAPMIPAAVGGLWLSRRTTHGGHGTWIEPAPDDREWQSPEGYTVTSARLAELARGVLGTPTAAKLWRWLCGRARCGERAAVPGGYDELARQLGVVGTRQKNHLREAMWTLHNLTFPTAGGGHDWIMRYAYDAAAPGCPAQLRITFGDPIRPHYFRDLPRGCGAQLRADRQLIPVLKPSDAPPPVTARKADRGPLWTLQDLIVREFAALAITMHRDGSVHLPPARLGALASEAGVRGTLDSETIMAEWTAPGSSDLFAPLEAVDAAAHRFRLGYDEAQACIESLGAFRDRQSRRAKRARTGGTKRPRKT
jgi:hypothetical protein